MTPSLRDPFPEFQAYTSSCLLNISIWMAGGIISITRQTELYLLVHALTQRAPLKIISPQLVATSFVHLLRSKTLKLFLYSFFTIPHLILLALSTFKMYPESHSLSPPPLLLL